MAINFDQLPQDNPNGLITPGVYRAKIVEATMQAPKNDPSKPDYLSIKLALFDKNNKTAGNIYDVISESDKSQVQYKTGRFVRACGIPLTGAMELKDLAKLVPNKNIAVDINNSKATEQYPSKSQVDLFSRQVYYKPEEFDEVYALIHPDEAEAADFVANNSLDSSDEEVPFNAQDGGAPSTRATY